MCSDLPKNNPHYVDSFISYQGKQDDELYQIKNENNDNYHEDNHSQQQIYNINKPSIVINDKQYDTNSYQNYHENSLLNDDSFQNTLNSYNNQNQNLTYNQNYANKTTINHPQKQSQYDYGVENQRQIHNQYHHNEQNPNINLNKNKELKYEETLADKSQQRYHYKILANLRCKSTLNGVAIENRQSNQDFLENSSNYNGNAGGVLSFNDNNSIKNYIDDFLELSSNEDVNLFKISILYLFITFRCM